VNDLTVIVPSWNTCELLLACLDSLEPVARAGAQVIVIDDASGDGSAEAAERAAPWAEVVRLANRRGFTAVVNRGWEGVTRPFVLLLNADARLEAGCASALLAFLREHPDYAAAAPLHRNTDGTLQRGCMAFPRLATALWFATPLERLFPNSRELRRYFLRDWDHEGERDVDQPPASALLLRRSVIGDGQPLDGAMELFFSDVDLCRRLRGDGWRLRYLDRAQVTHARGASTGQLTDFVPRWHADRLAYYRKHHGPLSGPWVKGCATFAALGEAFHRVATRTRSPQPLRPLFRELGAFLRS
jgi:GT2 family glycosyltransferase